jgi:hypothetical protein
VAFARVLKILSEQSERPIAAALGSSAALCAAFNLLTLKRAWCDGSRCFNCLARCAA